MPHMHSEHSVVFTPWKPQKCRGETTLCAVLTDMFDRFHVIHVYFFIHHMQHVKQTDYYSQSFPCFFTFNSSKKLPGSAFSRPGSEMPCGSRCRIALMFACWGDPGDGFGADGIGGWDSIGEDSLWLWLTVRHGFSMAHWNRGWPVNSMVIFHGELLVITRWYLVRSTNAWIYPLVI